MGGQESCRPWGLPCWDEARLLPLSQKAGCVFLFGKRSRCGLGVTAAELCFLVGRRAGVLPRAQLPPAFIQRSGLRKGGDFGICGGAQAVGWPANSKREYMRAPPGMVEEKKRALLELTSVKEVQLESMEQAEGKTAFPHPCPHSKSARDSSLHPNQNC